MPDGNGTKFSEEKYPPEERQHLRHRQADGDQNHLKSLELPLERPKGKSERLRWFGKDGPGGHWYIRVPLWLQTTFLIFFIGFLSLLLLTVVSAVQVWSYTENLMQNRLSSLAGMTAIELEQTFRTLERSVDSVRSSDTLLNLLIASNDNRSLASYWQTFNKENSVQLAFSDCLAMVLYDQSLKPIYSYRKRLSVDPFIGEQSSIIPKKLFPISDPDLKDNMLAALNKTLGGVLANATVNQVDENSSSINLTYSVTMGISSDLATNSMVSKGQEILTDNVSREWIGYSTFVMELPVSSTVMSEQLFSRYIVEVVRLNDINLGDSDAASLQKGNFSFLYPFISDNGTVNYEQTWPISSFPVLLDAVNSPISTSHFNDSSQNSTHQSSINGTANSIHDDLNDFANYMNNDALRRRAALKTPIDGTLRKLGNSSERGSSSNSSTNMGQGNSSSALNSFVDGDESALKTDAADMRTTTPFGEKSSVGYSFANIYNQKWFVFVQIPESEAFTDARHVRNVVIAVAGGILGAVFLILLPLSRLQTKGFYVIYQNMKLRPLEFREENEGIDFDETGPEPATRQTSLEDKPSNDDVSKKIKDVSKSLNRLTASGNDYNSGEDSGSEHKLPRGGHSSENSNTIEGPSSTSSLSLSRNQYIAPRSQDLDANSIPRDAEQALPESEVRYGLNTPKPLPPLSRWFKDEVDDLIQEYNNMTEKLNAHSLHLEDQVRLRTKEAQKARELREQANAAKSEFIAIISHELRTPLNGIMGLTAVSVDEQDMTKIRSALRIIIDSGHILMDLLNELLELSKSLVGVDPIINEFTPVELLEMLPNMFSSRAPTLSVSFAMAVVPSIARNVKLRGDMEHIAQVCLNFLSNAMKFSEDNNEVSVMSHIRPLNDPLISLTQYGDGLKNANAIIEILVTDSGVGISKAHLAKIFDLFVQGEDPLRKNRKGAGLGMALSKQLAEGIGGYVAVFSAKDVGTTTIIRAPVEVVGFSAEDVIALNGPQIEFKVSDVYSTISLRSGEVSAVLESKIISPSLTHQNTLDALPTPHNSQATSHFPQRWHSQNHQHPSGGGSRTLLTRSHPVSKLLRVHTQHNHNKSVYSSKSQVSRQSGSTEGTLDSAPGSKINGGCTIPAVIGSHSNTSTSSVLLDVPELILNADNPLRHQNSARSRRSESTSNEGHLIQTLENAEHKSSSSLPLVPHESNRPRRQVPSLDIVSHSMDTSAVLSQTSHKNTSREPTVEPQTSSSDPLKFFVSSPQRSPSPTPNLDTNARVMVAEDNKINQDIMVKLLEQMGIKNVDVADNGNSVIKLVEKSIVGGFHYGVIFMDLSMPGMNGIDATQIIRTTLGYPYPIIALTGFSDIQTRNACLAVNIQQVITKPVMRNDILHALQKHISNTQKTRLVTAKDSVKSYHGEHSPDLDPPKTARTL